MSQDLDPNRAATRPWSSLWRGPRAFKGPIAGYFMDRHGHPPAHADGADDDRYRSHAALRGDQLRCWSSTTHSTWPIRLFIPLFSVVESTFPINWLTMGEYFGRKNFAKIRGSMSFVSTWGSVVGPVLAGAIYDRTQSYDIMIWSSAVLLQGASGLYASVKKTFVPVLPAQPVS